MSGPRLSVPPKMGIDPPLPGCYCVLTSWMFALGEAAPMDGSTFDALTRTLTIAGSRRHTLGGLLAGALGLLGSRPEDAAAKKKPCPPCKKRKKGKCKKKLPDGTACAGGTCQRGRCVPTLPPVCPPESPTPCGGNYCCLAATPLCCAAPPEVSLGFGCYEADRHCCPAAYGGSACRLHETCCPPRKGEFYPVCADPALGYQCCPFNSGGASGPGQQCCPPETTNDLNRGT